MTEGAEKSVEELLAEAAQVTEAATPPKSGRKPRTPKVDAEGNPVEKAEKAPRAPKEPAKTYPQANEDGTPALDADGNPVMGPYKTRYKEPKAPKAPRLDADGNPITRQSNVFPLDAKVFKVEGKGAGYREGSKRKANFDLIPEGGCTVAEYYEKGGGKSVVHTFLVWYINEDQSVRIEVGEPVAE